MSRDETQQFFEAYRDAFNRLDGDAVADLWHAPSGIADARGGAAHLTWWSDEAPMRDNHRRLCALYRDAGYARADFEVDHFVPLGPQHAFARLRWTLLRRDGSVLQRFGTGYHLMHTAGGAKVLMCTAFEEDLQAMREAPAPSATGSPA